MLMDTNNPISTTDLENAVSAPSTAIIYTNEQVVKKYNSMLQLKDLRAGQREESCIRVNTRELDRELYTRLSTLYTNLRWSMLLLV